MNTKFQVRAIKARLEISFKTVFQFNKFLMKNQFLRISFENKLTFRVNLFSKIFSNKLLVYQEKKKKKKKKGMYTMV